MLADGLTLAAGAGLSIQMLDDSRRGPEFPSSPTDNMLWELTVQIDNQVPGIYEYTRNAWVLRNPSSGAIAYDVSGTVFGRPDPGVKVMMFASPRAFAFQGSLAGAIGRSSGIPSTRQDFIVNISRATGPEGVGILRFEAGSDEAVFIPNSYEPIQVHRKDIIVVFAPDTIDEYLADVSFTICGYLSV